MNNSFDYRVNNNTLLFKGYRYRARTLEDILLKKTYGCHVPQKSLEKIREITPAAFAGTRCKGSIPLKSFWDFVEKDNSHHANGFSTNINGFAGSFLKTKSNIPISTSYVHDCSVMYMYDNKSQTHALYHAAPNCSAKDIKFIIETLMPEGFSFGAIIPGDFVFYVKHRPNMENMLKFMKNATSRAIVNVFHSLTRFPEIVGFRGEVFEIPNSKVREQLNDGIIDVFDFGQASFKISDIQEYNTFDNINNCKSTKELQKLKEAFLRATFPQEILDIMLKKIEERSRILSEIENCSDIDRLEDLKLKFPQKDLKISFITAKENILINELRTIKTIEELRKFYAKIQFDLIHMYKLLDFLQEKKKEFF